MKTWLPKGVVGVPSICVGIWHFIEPKDVKTGIISTCITICLLLAYDRFVLANFRLPGRIGANALLIFLIWIVAAARSDIVFVVALLLSCLFGCMIIASITQKQS